MLRLCRSLTSKQQEDANLLLEFEIRNQNSRAANVIGRYKEQSQALQKQIEDMVEKQQFSQSTSSAKARHWTPSSDATTLYTQLQRQFLIFDKYKQLIENCFAAPTESEQIQSGEEVLKLLQQNMKPLPGSAKVLPARIVEWLEQPE